MPLIPSMFRKSQPDQITAAVEIMDGTGVAPIPGSVLYTPAQRRAAQYVANIGFVGRSFRFVAWQGARCSLRPERVVSAVEVQTPAFHESPIPWGVLDTIQPSRGSQADLVRSSVFDDDTVGEFFIVLDDRGATPRWEVFHPEAVEPKKGGSGIGGRAAAGFLVKDVPGGKVAKGTARWVPASHVFRHWQPSDRYPLLAGSSVLGMMDELDTYWTISRNVRRTARSQLAAGGGFLWTPTEAHAARHPDNARVSQLEYEYAQATTLRLNDADDLNVSSSAPMLFKTPGGATGQMPKPEMIEIPGLTAEMLAHLTAARVAVADALPLAASSVLAEAEGNHWNEWLADEEDIELIEDRLTRVLASWTEAAYRPTLARMVEAGVWDGDPNEWRIGFDVDPIRRRPDNSANAAIAAERALISFEAQRRELHFSEDDAPSDLEIRQMLTIAAIRAGKATLDGAPAAAPVAATHAPPASPVPELPPAPGGAAGEVVASLPVIDDRWLLDLELDAP